MNITLDVIITHYQIIYYNCNFEKNLIEKKIENVKCWDEFRKTLPYAACYF